MQQFSAVPSLKLEPLNLKTNFSEWIKIDGIANIMNKVFYKYLIRLILKPFNSAGYKTGWYCGVGGYHGHQPALFLPGSTENGLRTHKRRRLHSHNLRSCKCLLSLKLIEIFRSKKKSIMRRFGSYNMSYRGHHRLVFVGKRSVLKEVPPINCIGLSA